MKIILLQNIKKLGRIGQVIEVARGFGRNYLLPNSLALIATKTNIDLYSKREKDLKILDLEKKEAALLLKNQISDLKDKFSITSSASKEGRLYGTITNNDMSESFYKQYKIKIPASAFIINNKIKSLGTYSINLSLHHNVSMLIEIEIISARNVVSHDV